MIELACFKRHIHVNLGVIEKIKRSIARDRVLKSEKKKVGAE